MSVGSRLLRGDSPCFRHVRIGMRHRTELRDEQRECGDDREAQPKAMFQSWQRLNLKSDAGDVITVRANTELLHTIGRLRGNCAQA